VPLDRELLTNELRTLRKGRGVLEHQLRRRVGRQLSHLCEIPEASDTALIRERVGSTVVNLLKDLPPDLRLAVAAALAIAPGVQHRFLTERVGWLADRLNCDDRTARRRIDHGFDLLVESALRRESGARSTPAGAVPDACHVESFRGVLRLDTPSPELIEERTIVAIQDAVSEIVVAFSLPRPSREEAPEPDLDASVLHGGRIKYPEHVTDSHYRYVVELPRPLRRGETHHYAVQYKLPYGRPISPHYTIVPLRPCKSAELIVRFPADRPPRTVWLLDGVPPRVIDSTRPVGSALTPDRVGEVHLSFRNPRQGLGYGMAWLPGEPTAFGAVTDRAAGPSR
jgi:hypothetical protein